MKTWALRLALLLLYCVPFAFLSVNGDATSRTMIFYVLLVVGFTGLCWGALKTNNIPIIYIGNVLSFVSSYIVAKLSGLDPMGYYFKPFTVYSLIVALSIVAVICQTIPVLVHIARKKKVQ